MKFTLKHYNDLGRCSMGTLLDEFDTEEYEILLDNEKVEINKVEDLFPFLWQSPGCYVRRDGKQTSHFWTKGTHWHKDYDKSIDDGLKQLEKLKNKLMKEKDEKKSQKIFENMNFTAEHINALQRICDRCDAEMKRQQEELIKENA